MEISVKVSSIDVAENGAFVISLIPYNEHGIIDNAIFVQTRPYSIAGVAVTPAGSIIYDGTRRPDNSDSLYAPTFRINNETYRSNTELIIFNESNKTFAFNVTQGANIAYNPISNLE